MHWFSYLLGLLTLPALFLIVIGIRSLLERTELGNTRRLRALGPDTGPAGSALEFTPRLVGKIRQPNESEEHPAKAS